MDPAHWPPFGVEVRTPDITLRPITDELGADVAELAASGVHDPSWTPFLVPWTDVTPPRLQTEMFRFWWSRRVACSEASWSLQFAAITPDGNVVGAGDVAAADFGVLGVFETGSWLGRRHQGRGLGTAIRAALLHLGFEGLGAATATTSAFVDNAPSLGVTRSLGYRHVGTRAVRRRDERVDLLAYELSRTEWSERRDDRVELTGVDALRRFLGIPTP